MDKSGPADGIPPNPWGDRRRRAVGLLGGSFNPAHAGHRHIADLALRRFGLDEIWFLVSPQNPLKAANGMAPLTCRLDSVRQVAAGHPRLRPTALESRLGTRYTADTVALLRRRFPHIRFVWLMGADNLVQISRWARWRRIFQTLPVAILARSPYSYQALGAVAAHRLNRFRLPDRKARLLPGCRPPAWVFLHSRLHPASATEIRARRSSFPVL
jgi:nicotinate-nucleotide adenylyltransferase